MTETTAVLPEDDHPHGKLWLDTVASWITTVDHKRIGLLYIGYALVFLVIGGIEALVMRCLLYTSRCV